MGNEVLLFVPNIIGYIRLSLLLGSLLLYNHPVPFLCLYCVSAILDGFDGYFARKLNQTSAFGAWFDVVIDLITRGALWCFLSKWGYFVMMIEWLTFISTHCRGANWKIPDDQFPAICKMVMAKGFKTPIGAYAITGIFVLPLWVYGMVSEFLTDYTRLHISLQYTILVGLVAGRLLALTTELFFIQQHILGLLSETNTSKPPPVSQKVSTKQATGDD